LSTIYQLKNKNFLKKKQHSRTPGLKKCPQVKGAVKKARIVTPRKPNSARRPVAKVFLNNRKRITAHIPGIGHNIRSHSSVLIRGGGARDLPGVRYSCVRGVYDFAGLAEKRRRRSIYGAKQNIKDFPKKNPRRKFRIK
jgi:small subunit ribosomal protein S12